MRDLVDIGVNLTDARFDGDRRAVVGRARASGVHQMVVTGTSVGASEAAAALSADFPGLLFATAGVHPHDARNLDTAGLERLSALYALDSVVAVGECGLDFNRDFSPRPVQERVFEAQLARAAALNMPVFLHQRDALDRFLDILRPWRSKLPGAVLHCFTDGPDALRACLDLDLHIGVTGWVCDERRGQDLRAAVPLIPGDRLMIETDAPWLLPRDLRPRPKKGRNEPAFLPHIASAVAALRGTTGADIAASSTRVARRFFGLPAASVVQRDDLGQADGCAPPQPREADEEPA